MIPYFSYTAFHVGPLTIHVWGLLVAIGMLAGTFVAAKFARERGLKGDPLWDLLFWAILAGFAGARLFHVIAYHADIYAADPARIFALQDGGYSSIGGFIGAAIAGVIYLRIKKLDVWAYADTAIFGLPLGYAIGRLGCFLIHDHPGTATDFFLGVRYPDGVVRHDLGLYQAIDGAVLFVIFLILRRMKAPMGIYIATFLIWYGVTRFFLDFLRATDGAIVDARYVGLTPAQFAAIAMVIGGGCAAAHIAKGKKQP